MSLFDEVALAQKREREREAAFKAATAALAALSRADQVIVLARLANVLDATATTAALPNGSPPPVRPAPALAPASGASSEAPMGVTAAAKKVLQESATPAAIDEIVERVLTILPGAKKAEIYSATYKSAKRGEFTKHPDGSYSYNHDYRRGGGGAR